MTMVDMHSEAFARRLANLMVATRRQRRLSIGAMARRSEGRFSRRDLKACEAGVRRLDEPTVLQLSGLYGCEISEILPSRLPIAVGAGHLTAGGVSVPFDLLNSTSLLEAYLRLVRSLRRQKSSPTVELRRDDIEILAEHLHESGEAIVERLGALMGATRGQRTAMAGLFATGAVVIGLVGTAAASSAAPDDVTLTVRPARAVDLPVRDARPAGVGSTASNRATTAVATTEIVATEPSLEIGLPPATSEPVTTDPSALDVTQPPILVMSDDGFVDTDLTSPLVETGTPPVP